MVNAVSGAMFRIIILQHSLGKSSRFQIDYIFMPPTSKKLEGHIASGAFVLPVIVLFDA